MKRLRSSLQFAHAAELAAYYAYDGHYRSVSNPDQRRDILQIRDDEMLHINTLASMLSMIDSKPSKAKDFVGVMVGRCIGLACFIFGWKLPMKVAALMERIGTKSYYDIAEEAARAGYGDFSMQLIDMAGMEEEHERYFNEVRNK